MDGRGRRGQRGPRCCWSSPGTPLAGGDGADAAEPGRSPGDGPGAAGCGGLQHTPGLTSLGLSGNTLGGEGGAAAVCGGLRHAPGLQSLDLSWNAVGKEGAAALAPQTGPGREAARAGGGRLGK